MRVCHSLSADFDDPNLIASAGLVPVMTLAQKAGLSDLVAEHVRVPGSPGANADLKVATLVAGADSIEDMDLARHGGMPKIFAGCRAPTTLGTHLRGYEFGHVRQLDAVASRLLVNLAHATPLLGGATSSQHYCSKWGHFRLAHSPTVAPVIVGTRLRKGNASSAHGAARMIADAVSTSKKAGATGMVTVRADSAYYNHDVITATTTAGAYSR